MEDSFSILLSRARKSSNDADATIGLVRGLSPTGGRRQNATLSSDAGSSIILCAACLLARLRLADSARPSAERETLFSLLRALRAKDPSTRVPHVETLAKLGGDR